MPQNTTYVTSYPVVKTEVAHRLRTLRAKMDPPMTKEDVADTLGISRKTYGSWEDETKTAMPGSDLAVFWALCDLLGASPMYVMTGLFREEGEMVKHSQEYLDIYDRYNKSPDFHYLLSALMERSDHFVKGLASFLEVMDDEYDGIHPMLR